MRSATAKVCLAVLVLIWGTTMTVKAQTELRASDVFLSSRWENPIAPAMLQLYGANRLVWVYSTNPVFVERIHAAGASYTGAVNAGNTDLGAIAACTDLQGEPLVAPWQVNFQPVRYWGDAANAMRRRQLLQSVLSNVNSGADGIHVDDWRMNYSALAWGGCFTDACMAGFRAYLQEKLDAAELAALGISDPATFDFRQYLSDRYQIRDRAGYLARAASIPLVTHFREYAIDLSRKTLAWLKEEALQAAGGPLTFSVNGNFERTSDEHWFVADLVDYLVGESDAGPDNLLKLLGNLGLASGVGTPMVVSPRRPDLNPGALRQDIALTYALGHYFLVPWDVWLYDSERYYAKPEEYAHIYRFIRQHRALFDGYEIQAEIGLVVSTAVDNPILAGYLRELLRSHIPFDVVPLGGRYLHIKADVEQLRRYKYLVTVSDLAALPEQAAQAIEKAAAAGVIVLNRAEFARRVRQPEFKEELAVAQVENGNDIHVIKRVRPDGAAPAVYHVLNRRYDKKTDAVLPARDVVLHFSARHLEGRKVGKAVFYAPEPAAAGWPGPPIAQLPGLELPVKTTATGVSVTLPELQEWAIVSLE
jgi:hypothetical protein